MTSFVFAYGSNMCSGRFRDYGMTHVGPGRAALLEGFSLSFKKPSTDGSGKATVSNHPSGYVWGVLYEIPTDELAKLDGGERGYVRETATVVVEDKPVTAWLYVATRSDEINPLRPYSWYKRFLVEGAREHGLPIGYILRLKEVEDQIDPERERHDERMALVCTDDLPREA